MTATPTGKVEDFASEASSRVTVRREAYDAGECRRFHLSFSYLNGRGTVSRGDQVVHARDIGQAVVRIAGERGIDRLFVSKRHFSGKPASEAELINTVFLIETAKS